MIRLLVALAFASATAIPVHAEDLLVSAAASLTDALKEIGAKFEKASNTKVVFNFGASSMLARQIEEGAPADIFLSADEAQMNRLQNKIVPTTRADLLTNVLVVIARKDSAQSLSQLSDLAKPEVTRIAIADPQAVPAGVYAKEVLIKAKLWDKIEPKIAPTENVRATLAVVEAGNADAGFVYKTDSMISATVRIALEIPAEFAPKIVYPAAIVARSKHQEQAQRFLAFLKTEEAGQVFRRLGFGIIQ
jgi:molybdate transport system substrate-binding protein